MKKIMMILGFVHLAVLLSTSILAQDKCQAPTLIEWDNAAQEFEITNVIQK